MTHSIIHSFASCVSQLSVPLAGWGCTTWAPAAAAAAGFGMDPYAAMTVEGGQGGDFAAFDGSMGVQMEKSGGGLGTKAFVKAGPLVAVLTPFLVGLLVGVFVVPHDGGGGDCSGGAPPASLGSAAVGGPGCPVCPSCPPAGGGPAPAPSGFTTLADIQAVAIDATGGDRSAYEGQVVRVQGVVEAVHEQGLFIADATNNFGLYVYVDPNDAVHGWPTTADGSPPSAGDQVELQGEILEYYGVTELTRVEPDNSRIVSSGNSLVPATDLDGNALAEEHEGVMVHVEGDCLYHDIGHGEWVIQAAPGVTIIIDDMLDPEATPEYNHRYSVEGIGHFSYGAFKVEATTVMDQGAGALTDPEGTYTPPTPAPDGSPGSAPSPAPAGGGGGITSLSDIQAVSVDLSSTLNDGDHSPFESQVVQVAGLVMGVHGHGFFIQDTTDHGLYCYIDPSDPAHGPPGTPVVGDQVELTGTIVEVSAQPIPSTAWFPGHF